MNGVLCTINDAVSNKGRNIIRDRSVAKSSSRKVTEKTPEM